MREFAGRTAVVTGAASGIGLALARDFAAAGMNVVLADVEAARLDEVRAGFTTPSLARACDVSKAEDVRALADAAFEAFGAVHVLCNNAGVTTSALAWEQSEQDWTWILDVNLWGVVHGIRAFLPRMLAAGSEGHVVNTSSMTGMAPGPRVAAYAASKAAVIALSESLQQDLLAAGARVRAHVLLPSFTRTRILEAARNRPRHLGGGSTPAGAPEAGLDRAQMERLFAEGQDPAEVAAAVIDALRHDRFWIAPHAASLERARIRCERFAALENPSILVAGVAPGGPAR